MTAIEAELDKPLEEKSEGFKQWKAENPNWWKTKGYTALRPNQVKYPTKEELEARYAFPPKLQ